MSGIFENASKHAAYISLKLGTLKKDSMEYLSLKSTKEAILELGKELSITNGTNSDTTVEKKYKSRPVPACRATHSANQSIPHGGATATELQFDTVDYDDVSAITDRQANMHSGSVNNTKFYAHETGKYRFAAHVVLDTDAAATFAVLSIIRYDKFGNVLVLVQHSTYLAVDFSISLSCATESFMEEGEYAVATVFQETAGSLARNSLGSVVSGIYTYKQPSFCMSGPM